MLLRPSRDIDMTKPRLMLRNRVLALGCLLLSPMRSSAFLLNLALSPTPAQQHHQIVAGSRSSSYGSAASSASTVGTARGSAGRIRCRTVRLAAAAGGSGNSSPKSEKVNVTSYFCVHAYWLNLSQKEMRRASRCESAKWASMCVWIMFSPSAAPDAPPLPPPRPPTSLHGFQSTPSSNHACSLPL